MSPRVRAGALNLGMRHSDRPQHSVGSPECGAGWRGESPPRFALHGGRCEGILSSKERALCFVTHVITGSLTGCAMEQTATRLRALTASRGRRFLAMLAVAALYYFSARLSMTVSFERSNASPVWPPAGIALVAVLLLGYRVWPGIMLGDFLVNCVMFLEHRVAGNLTISLASFCMSVGGTVEALSGAYLLRRFTGPAPPFYRTKDYLYFVGIALVVCMVGGTIDTSTLCFSGIAQWYFYGTLWMTFFDRRFNRYPHSDSTAFRMDHARIRLFKTQGSRSSGHGGVDLCARAMHPGVLAGS